MVGAIFMHFIRQISGGARHCSHMKLVKWNTMFRCLYFGGWMYEELFSYEYGASF